MTRLPPLRSVVRVGVLLVIVGVGVVAVVRSGEQLRESAAQLSPLLLVLSFAAALCALACVMLSWRAVMADLGSDLPTSAAVRVFFPAQLGKYVPGSVWALVAQMELGREHGVPRSRSGAGGLVTLGVGLLAGLLVTAVTLPFSAGAALERYWWAFLAVPAFAVALLPAVANPVLDRALRLVGRAPLERPLSGRGLVRGFGWSVVGWLAFGVHTWLLARALDADGSALLLVCTGAYALSWTIGFLVVVAPAGAGVREAALVLTLASVLDREQALLLALVSRALVTVADLAWAVLGLAAAGRWPGRGLRPAVSAPAPPAPAARRSDGPGS